MINSGAFGKILMFWTIVGNFLDLCQKSSEVSLVFFSWEIFRIL